MKNPTPRLRSHLDTWVPAVSAFAALLSLYVAYSQYRSDSKNRDTQASTSAKQDQMQAALLDLQKQLVRQGGEATRASLVVQIKLLPAKTGVLKGTLVPKQEIKNEGRTSAQIVSSVYAAFYKTEKRANELKLDTLSVIKPDDSLATIGSELMHATPNVTVEGLENTVKSPQEFAQHMRADFLYVWGSLLYRDIFNQQHLAKFCYSHKKGEPLNEVYACPFLNTMNEEVGPESVYVTPTAEGFKISK